MKTILNFTGHAMSSLVVEELQQKFGHDVQIITIKFGLKRHLNSWDEMKRILEPYHEHFNTGDALHIILPGFNVAVAHLLTYAHGVYGTFPKFIELIRNHSEGVFVIKDIHDLEFNRQKSRKNRNV